MDNTYICISNVVHTRSNTQTSVTAPDHCVQIRIVHVAFVHLILLHIARLQVCKV